MSLWSHFQSFWLGVDYAASEAVTDKPNVTISSRIAMARDAGKWWGVWGCKALNVMFLTSDHCTGALQHDKERAEAALKELQDEQAKLDNLRGGPLWGVGNDPDVGVEHVPTDPPAAN